MRKNVRIIVIITLTAMTILSLLMLYRAYTLPDEMDRYVIVTRYSQSSFFDHIVNLNPNKLYDNNTIVGSDPNQTYFAKIVKDVSTTFRYKIDATDATNVIDSGTKIQGNYDITAVLSTDTWNKKFVLIPRREFNGTGKADFIDGTTIDVNYYNNVLINITKEIDVQPKDIRLELIYNINTVITKDGKEARESFIPIIKITSTRGAFNIQGDIVKKNDSVIKKVEKEIQFDVLEERTNFSIITVISIFTIVILIIITKNRKEEINDVEKKVQDFKKKYGDLIIYSKDSKLPKASHVVTIDSIDDLIKVAEQLEEPIINSGNMYYVYDGSTIYAYYM